MSVATQELRDAARQVVDDQGLAADEEASWALLAELGWLMLEIPEEDGGLGLDLAAACALHRELGRGLASAPYLAATLAIDAVAQSALDGRADLLERLGGGAACVVAPLAASNLAGDGGALSGTVEAVPSVERADHVLVWSAAGDCVALVAPTAAGVTAAPCATWDATRRFSDLRVEAATPAYVLAQGEDAGALLRRIQVRRDFALAAEAVGGAAAILERTVAYLGERAQFGRPLAMFQALKHRCADLKAQVEAADALLEDGLARGVGAHGALDLAAAEPAGLAAKLLANSTYTWVVEEALQLHGGIGMTAEHECHLFLKRALLDEHLGRGRDTYARLLAAGIAAAAH